MEHQVKMESYNQFYKRKDRHFVIKNAIEKLTIFRENACCVSRNYVRNIYDYLTLTEDESENKLQASKIEINYISDWEKLHDSYIGYKRPSDLTVCY